MKQLNRCRMISLYISLTLSALLLSTTLAKASNILKLKTHVTIKNEIVTIGDIFSNAGVLANTPLFKGPALGNQGTISISHLIEAADRYGFTFDTPLNQKRITVSRPARIIKSTVLEAMIEAKLNKQLEKQPGQKIAITYDKALEDHKLPLNTNGKMELTDFRYNKSYKTFSAFFSLGNNQDPNFKKVVKGRIALQILRPILTRSIKRGQTIQTADIKMQAFNPYRVPKNSIEKAEMVIGQIATKTLSNGNFLKTSDLESPKMIKKNQLVTIIFKKAGLTLKTQGKATEPGGYKDVITVMNIHSKRVIHGVVQSPGVVLIPAEITADLQKTAQLN